MSKQHSPSSNNSGTSSETSETQSVEENNTSDRGTPDTAAHNSTTNRTTKIWKRMKEPTVEKDSSDGKRPPWRAVSVSTLPKPDKNALLRAKLLDASRRLRASKCSIAVQTDIVPTKLMKEVNLDVQHDLIFLKDVGILTDGLCTMRKEGSGEFILTYSVSQMTDAVVVNDTSTQTLLPKVPGDDFMEAYYTYDQRQLNLNEFSTVERKLLEQIRNIRESRRMHLHQKPTIANESSDNSISEGTSSETDTDTTDSKTTIAEAPLLKCPRRSFLTPTYSSWHFDYDEQYEIGKYFQPYSVIQARPGSSLNYAELSNKFSTAKLLPIVDRRLYPEYRNVNTSVLNAIDELILESNNLVDTIEGLKQRRAVHKKHSSQEMESVPAYKPKTPITFPSDYWLPIIEQQEKELKEKIKGLKYPKIRKVKKFDLTVDTSREENSVEKI